MDSSRSSREEISHIIRSSVTLIKVCTLCLVDVQTRVRPDGTGGKSQNDVEEEKAGCMTSY